MVRKKKRLRFIVACRYLAERGQVHYAVKPKTAKDEEAWAALKIRCEQDACSLFSLGTSPGFITDFAA